MAERRMFAKTIVLSDAFLDMPMSARCLYFTLGMLADDDGFVNSPKSIMRQCGASDDDLKVLLMKKYVLAFEDGVIVIKHWRLNNYIQNDRKIETKYKEHLAELGLDENKSYTFRDVTDSVVEVVEGVPLSDARQKRADAIKNSSLPYSFIYKIKNAFIGEKCPICNCRMGVVTDLTDPVRVPNPAPTIQHNIPISLGGVHELENISVICAKCNASIQANPTGDLNNALVRQKWAEICAKEEHEKKKKTDVSGMYTQDSIGKGRLEEDEYIDRQVGQQSVNDNVNDMSMTKEEFNRDERGREEEKKKKQKEKEGFFEDAPSYPNSIVSEFNELWKLYPKKEGRQTAFYAYQRARRDGATFEQVKKGIEDYIKFIKETNRGMEFVAQGKTWFNQRRWEDKHEYNKSQESVAGYEVNDFFRMAMEAGLKGVEK